MNYIYIIYIYILHYYISPTLCYMQYHQALYSLIYTHNRRICSLGYGPWTRLRCLPTVALAVDSSNRAGSTFNSLTTVLMSITL